MMMDSVYHIEVRVKIIKGGKEDEGEKEENGDNEEENGQQTDKKPDFGRSPSVLTRPIKEGRRGDPLANLKTEETPEKDENGEEEDKKEKEENADNEDKEENGEQNDKKQPVPDSSPEVLKGPVLGNSRLRKAGLLETPNVDRRLAKKESSW